MRTWFKIPLIFLLTNGAFLSAQNVNFDGSEGGSENLIREIKPDKNTAELAGHMAVDFGCDSDTYMYDEEKKGYVSLKPYKTLSREDVTEEWIKIPPSFPGKPRIRKSVFNCTASLGAFRYLVEYQYEDHPGHYNKPSSAPAFGWMPPGLEQISDEEVVKSTVPRPVSYRKPGDSGKMYYFYDVMPEFASKITEQLDLSVGCQEKDWIKHIEVKVEDLVELSTGPNYVLVGTTTYHPYNHYGTQETIDALIELADDFESACPGASGPEYNDMSLIWGGLFDIKGNWATPHGSHRKGLNIDVNKRSIKKSNREKLIELMCKDFTVLSEGDAAGESPHYHLELKTKGNDWGSLVIFDTDPRYTKCCVEGEVPEKCIKLYDHGSVENEPNLPSDCK